MQLTGRTVRFYLSDEGREALNGILPESAVSIEALVVNENHLGAWIWSPATAGGASDVVLLKWNHFGTAVLAYELEAPEQRAKAGFR